MNLLKIVLTWNLATHIYIYIDTHTHTHTAHEDPKIQAGMTPLS
jgi:hypothetical protein